MNSATAGWLLVVAGLAWVLIAKSGRLAEPAFILIVALGTVIAVGVTAVAARLTPERTLTIGLLALFVSIIVYSSFGWIREWRKLPKPSGQLESAELIAGRNAAGEGRILFVLIHGLEGDTKNAWGELQPELLPHGDVLPLNYNAGAMSSSDPVLLAESMSARIEAVWQPSYRRVALIGHSMGALLARQTYLVAAERGHTWVNHDPRIVLLAGMNRGWDVSGEKPMDMSLGRRISIAAGAWFGRLTGTGKLILSTETGAPFVANLRLKWMRWFQSRPVNRPIVVQLLGDIDDVVSDADNQDLRAAALGERFYWLRVRGTGHGNIIKVRDTAAAHPPYTGIGDYRRDKILLAAVKDESEIAAQNEEFSWQTEPDVTHIVFVLHGIRDLGEWSAQFERALREKLPKDSPASLAVVSIRYGFFSMGSFLLRPDRQKFVRWFMDQYTETLARYPNARRIDFIGHSNGTYLLASALEKYNELKVDRIVFAGSVVRKDYPWRLLLGKQVEAVRNYISIDDAVVALFPRFFEPWGEKGLFGNDVGSAGFNGFEESGVQQLRITGGHDAFLAVADDIAAYIMAPSVPANEGASPAPSGGVMAKLLQWHSQYTYFLVPALIVLAVFLPGARVATSGGPQAWVYLVMYVGLVILLLKRL